MQVNDGCGRTAISSFLEALHSCAGTAVIL